AANRIRQRAFHSCSKTYPRAARLAEKVLERSARRRHLARRVRRRAATGANAREALVGSDARLLAVEGAEGAPPPRPSIGRDGLVHAVLEHTRPIGIRRQPSALERQPDGELEGRRD